MVIRLGSRGIFPHEKIAARLIAPLGKKQRFTS